MLGAAVDAEDEAVFFACFAFLTFAFAAASAAFSAFAEATAFCVSRSAFFLAVVSAFFCAFFAFAAAFWAVLAIFFAFFFAVFAEAFEALEEDVSFGLFTAAVFVLEDFVPAASAVFDVSFAAVLCSFAAFASASAYSSAA